MLPFDKSHSLHIGLDTKGCELTESEISSIEDGVDSLRNLVKDFPVSDLHVCVVHHRKSNDYHVKTSLSLPGTRIFTGERGALVYPAFEKCIRKLIKKVTAYKQVLHGDFELSKQIQGTHHTLIPTQALDIMKLEEAMANDDYAGFRSAADVYEDGLTKRIGRWIQRYPEIQSQLGQAVTISDIVEDVYITAFDQYPRRPGNVPIGTWLESLIDPCVQALVQSPDEEFANISFARSIRE